MPLQKRVFQDLRFAVRSLYQARGFTLAALLTLAVGMGANIFVYTALDSLLIRPLPFGSRSGRLVTLHSTHPTQALDWDSSLLSYADLLDVRESSRSLEAVEGLLNRNFSVTAARDTERVLGASVTPGLFPLLGVEPQRGRGFRKDEGAAPGTESVAIISDSLWHRLFGGDAGIVGRSLPVNGRALTIIGVMPPRFAFPEHHELWVPYRAPRDAGRDVRNVFVVGLLRDGLTREAARADAASIAVVLAARYPGTNRDWGILVMAMRDSFVREATRRAIGAMLVAVALVLLVACANIASLMVARGIGRQRELTIRAAIGAGRGRLVRLLMTEAAVLAIGGGYLGLLFASWARNILVASNPEPPPYWVTFDIDSRIVLFTFGLSAATAIVCGIIPALRGSASAMSAGLLQGGRGSSATFQQRRFQNALVASQIAVSFALLVGASLIARSTMTLQHADAGFNHTPLLSLRLYLAGDAYLAPAARAVALQRVVDRLQAIPGVASASATGAIPGDDGGEGTRLVPERALGLPNEELGAQAVPMTASLFSTLGLSVRDGRTFTTAETADPASDVVLVNQRLADELWPRAEAVGRTLRVARGADVVPYRVVGVVPEVVYEELGEETEQSRRIVYLPYARAGWRTMALLIRSTGSPRAVAGEVRRAIRDVEPAFAAYDLMTMNERRIFTSWGERFIGRTFEAFALAALTLCCIGAYGLTAYSAAQRVREMAVRMAIGATRHDIIRLLVGRGARLGLTGVLAGIPLAMIGARLLTDLLFRVSPWDRAVWLTMPVALVAAVLLANFLPARRASRVDPAVALRLE